jgi:hypothetical protein
MPCWPQITDEQHARLRQPTLGLYAADMSCEVGASSKERGDGGCGALIGRLEAPR